MMRNKQRSDLQERIAALRAELHTLEQELEEVNRQEQVAITPPELPLQLREYRRYGRQMILPGFGLPGQIKLKNARVLVVGAGGLGCPALLYLAGAGVGHLTIVDSDTVEVSNLHRQILHNMSTLGMPKADSAKEGIRRINPQIDVTPIYARFTPELISKHEPPSASIEGIEGPLVDLSKFDMAMDCTDNAKTRYLLSDACVRANITLVSGGAVGLEGWSGLWNSPEPCTSSTDVDSRATSSRGPCLRCIYPQSKYDNSGNCEDEGVLGPLTGVIGTLMATEAIKLITGLHNLKPSMTLYSPLSSPMFRNIKLRGRKPTCPGCGIEGDNVPSNGDINGEEEASIEFCGIPEEETDKRVNIEDFATKLLASSKTQSNALVVDVRPETEYGICSIPGSLNIPHASIQRDPSDPVLQQAIKGAEEVYLICRRGNDSLLDSRLLQKQFKDLHLTVRDVRGGLRAYSRVNPSFPVY